MKKIIPINFKVEGETKLGRYRKVTDTPSDKVTMADLELVEETEWMGNMVLNQGKNYMAKEGLYLWFYKYAIGTGSTSPTGTETTLEDEYATFTNLVDIGELINEMDYVNGYWTATRSWQSSEMTETVTFTNAGIKDSSSRLMTYLVFSSSFTANAGDYVVATYRIRFDLSGLTSGISLTTPISGVSSNATMQLESLIGVTQGIGATSVNRYYSDTMQDNGESARYYNETSQPFSWFWPYMYSGGTFDSNPRCFLSTFSDALSFSNNSQTLGSGYAFCKYYNWQDESAGYWVEDGSFDTYVDGNYYRDVTFVFDADKGNITDIKSIGFCGSWNTISNGCNATTYYLESLLRILFDTAFTKANPQVLTLTFRISWS